MDPNDYEEPGGYSPEEVAWGNNISRVEFYEDGNISESEEDDPEGLDSVTVECLY